MDGYNWEFKGLVVYNLKDEGVKNGHMRHGLSREFLIIIQVTQITNDLCQKQRGMHYIIIRSFIADYIPHFSLCIW